MLPLSPREDEIAALVAKGQSNHTIADSLKLAEATVKGHLKRIFLKTSCTNRTELAVHYAPRAPVKPARAKPPSTPPTGRNQRKPKR